MHKIGIVGCGGIARGKHLPALVKAAAKQRVEICALCDTKLERAQRVQKEFELEDAVVFTDYRELLAMDELSIVYVLTPNISHCEITIAALSANKHVMCEKPMAMNEADARRMLEASERTNKLLTFGYQNRQRSDNQFLKRYCEEGGLGDIYFARALALRRRAVPTWGVFPNKDLQGGGPLIDIGTHALDLCLWMMNNYEPQSVMGVTFEKLGRTLPLDEQGNAFGPWDPKTYSVEDSAFGFVRMKNGALIEISSSWALNTLHVGEARAEFCGTRAGADMEDGLRINFVKHGEPCVLKPACGFSGGVEFFDSSHFEKPEDRECRAFLDAVDGISPLVVTPQQAYTVTKILDATYQSAREGKSVQLS